MRSYLVVDDNLELAENVAEILADTGAHVDVASDGPSALERVARTRYDLLVSDMRMPTMGGAELVHRIRRVDPGLPALVMTAYTHADDLEAARREGLLAVLPKPVPVARLLELAAAARRDGLVAIVEDDPALADNLVEALRERGFAGVTAASVLETERLHGLRPCTALVDLRLPGGPDGEAMARLARAFPGLPMLVVSGRDDIAPTAPYRMRFGKPVPTAELLAAVERVWEERRG
jgi:CheY-like chemotaxis protein